LGTPRHGAGAGGMTWKTKPRRVRVSYRPARARYRTRAAASAAKPALLAAAILAAAAWGIVVARDAWARATWTQVRRVEILPMGTDGLPPDGFERAVGV